jgi:hypothetical protein
MAHPTGRPLVCALDGVVYAVAWADLAPSFQRAAGDMAVLRQMTQDFREPVIWVLFDIVARGIAEIVAFALLDQDLIKHDQAEAGVEDELSVIYGRLGQQLPSPRSGPGEGAGQLCRPDPGRDLLTRDLHVLMVLQPDGGAEQALRQQLGSRGSAGERCECAQLKRQPRRPLSVSGGRGQPDVGAVVRSWLSWSGASRTPLRTHRRHDRGLKRLPRAVAGVAGDPAGSEHPWLLGRL